VTQIETSKGTRSQKLQGTFKIKEIVETSNEEIAEIQEVKHLNLTETNHLIYAAATVITKDVNGTGCHKSETQSSKTPHWVICLQESINNIRKDLSVFAELERDEMKTQNLKRKRSLRKYKKREKGKFGSSD
jgi:hypothetical protein